MKIKDFIKREDDIDVYDDVDESLCIAFCGPLKLTDAGREYFKDVLQYNIEVFSESCTAVVNCDTGDERYEERLRKATEFFYSAAGYCSWEDYERWFEEE